MSKYLKIGVCSPYINTTHTRYVELSDDDFDDDGKLNEKMQDELVADAIGEYVDAWSDVVDEADVPPEEK